MTSPALHVSHGHLEGLEHQLSRRRFKGALPRRRDKALAYGRTADEAEGAGRPAKGNKRLFGELDGPVSVSEVSTHSYPPMSCQPPHGSMKQCTFPFFVKVQRKVAYVYVYFCGKIRIAFGKNCRRNQFECLEAVHE